MDFSHRLTLISTDLGFYAYISERLKIGFYHTFWSGYSNLFICVGHCNARYQRHNVDTGRLWRSPYRPAPRVLLRLLDEGGMIGGGPHTPNHHPELASAPISVHEGCACGGGIAGSVVNYPVTYRRPHGRFCTIGVRYIDVPVSGHDQIRHISAS